MKRFQRAKLERQVGDVRRELSGWAATYRTIVAPENAHLYDQHQLQVAGDRSYYLEYAAEMARQLEELLRRQVMP